MKGNITLNTKEQRLNNFIIKFISKEINITQVCNLTGLSERQIYRKKKAYKDKGIESIPHKLKLHPSKKGYDSIIKNKITAIILFTDFVRISGNLFCINKI